MTVFVKVCGLSKEQDVHAAIAAGADAVGFVFANSVRRISAATAAAISAKVPAHIKRVAVMLHPAKEDWLEVLQVFSPDVLQTDAEDFAELDVPATVAQWPVYREGGVTPMSSGTYVYEGQNSGQGKTVDWSQAAKYASKGKMILAGGLATENVAAAIAIVRPFGVDVSSAVESLPGQKDPQLITSFLTAVRAAEKNL